MLNPFVEQLSSLSVEEQHIVHDLVCKYGAIVLITFVRNMALDSVHPHDKRLVEPLDKLLDQHSDCCDVWKANS